MIANTITIGRTILTFIVILLFGYFTLDIALGFSIAFIFILDAVDGVVARKRNETSEIGAMLDTIADRIIENTFWIYFTVQGLIPLWMPIAVLTRGFITDALQREAFGYPTHGWGEALTRSRISRGLYGLVKMLAFVSLAFQPVFKSDAFSATSLILATFAVGFCLLRGIPFFFIRRQTFHYAHKTPFDHKKAYFVSSDRLVVADAKTVQGATRTPTGKRNGT